MLPFLSIEHVQQQQQQQQQQQTNQNRNTRHKQQPIFKKISISIFVISLPLLYVSFLHVPPSTLLQDTTFWFLMSNSIIIIIAADSGMLFFSSTTTSIGANDDFCDKLMTKDKKESYTNQDVIASSTSHANAVMEKSLIVREELAKPVGKAVVVKKRPGTRQPKLVESKSLEKKEIKQQPVQDKSIVLRRSATEGKRPSEESDQYATLSDEELNMRVEEFIKRFNREIRLQLENEGV